MQNISEVDSQQEMLQTEKNIPALKQSPASNQYFTLFLSLQALGLVEEHFRLVLYRLITGKFEDKLCIVFKTECSTTFQQLQYPLAVMHITYILGVKVN